MSSEADKSQTPQGKPTTRSSPEVPHEFLEKVQSWLKGEVEAATPYATPLLDDLKACVAERDTLMRRMHEAEKSSRETLAQHTHLSGRIDGLVGALYRLESHAAG